MKSEFGEILMVLNMTEVLYTCEQRSWIQRNQIQRLCKRLADRNFICVEMWWRNMNWDKIEKSKS